ncbi:MAG: NAD-binding protein [Pseudanabaenaceae cyanobacterium bins.39]|nr:NAD-binding protein [Pseudanabaenaceae cyanobacterium bins.39]
MRSLGVLIKNQLLESNIKVNITVRQKREELHILLESTYFGDRELLKQTILECCHGDLNFDIHKFTAIRIYGFSYGEPLPELVESLSLRPQPQPPEHQVSQKSNLEENLTVCDRFIVCGLGSLGQHAVFNLKKFAYGEYTVQICAINQVKPEVTEFERFSELLDEHLIIGDCRRDEILIKAGIHNCRSILIVTSNENTNIETAITARRLNPHVHIVVRSSRHNLNQLLKEQLGNFVALDPVDLPAAAFAVAGIGEGTLGLFQIGDRKLRVAEYQLTNHDYQFLRTPAYLLHKKQFRLISAVTPSVDRLFFQWEPHTTFQVGDQIAFIELVEHDLLPSHSHVPNFGNLSPHPNQSLWQRLITKLRQSLNPKVWQSQWYQFQQWIKGDRTRQLILWSTITTLILWLISTAILFFNVPNMSWQKAASTSIVLLLGGFGDIFGGLEENRLPLWLVLYCLSITLVSLLFVLGIISIIADKILSSKFEFFKRSLPIPHQDHIVLIGFGRLGQRIADFLHRLNVPMVIVSENSYDGNLSTKVPWITGNITQELTKTNLNRAKSIIAVTDDQMLNLEVALLAKEANKHNSRPINLTIRTYDRYFSENLVNLLPSSQSFCAYALSAEAFAGAAFGENMLSLFRLHQRTVLVAEYEITANDTLVGKNLSQIAYGYTVVPVYLRKNSAKADGIYEFFIPADDEVMNVGDRLTVLASISGLRRIELGNLHAPRLWQLRAKPPLNPTVLLDAGNKLRNISGCDLDVARKFIDSLPAAIELPMYDIQAYRLGQALIRLLPIKIYPL